MNDFTKEELKLLFGGLQLWMEEILYEDEKDRTFRNELYKKIQSMIDNYCEPTNSMIVAQIKYWNEELTKRENSAIQGDVKCL